jgi:hypothetical protein
MSSIFSVAEVKCGWRIHGLRWVRVFSTLATDLDICMTNTVFADKCLINRAVALIKQALPAIDIAAICSQWS